MDKQQNGRKFSPEVRARAVRMVIEHRNDHDSEWVDWFNNRRLLEPIGNIPPAEAEAAYYAQIEEFAMVA
jgi:putative transposase